MNINYDACEKIIYTSKRLVELLMQNPLHSFAKQICLRHLYVLMVRILAEECGLSLSKKESLHIIKKVLKESYDGEPLGNNQSTENIRKTIQMMQRPLELMELIGWDTVRYFEKNESE